MSNPPFPWSFFSGTCIVSKQNKKSNRFDELLLSVTYSVVLDLAIENNGQDNGCD